MPAAVAEALAVEEIAQRYHCLPEVAAEAGEYTMRHMEILKLIQPAKEPQMPSLPEQDESFG